MAALVGAGGGGAGSAGGTEEAGQVPEIASSTEEIDFEAEAQARGMQLLSCTRVSPLV